VCKSQNLEGKSFTASDGYIDIHHSCRDCGSHFDHLDGTVFEKCDICSYTHPEKKKKNMSG
jgi:transposase-like protein